MALRGLEGKVAVVTGAARGIGAGVVARLAEEGCRVVVVDLDHDAARATAAALPGEAIGVAADVSTEAGVDGYMAAALERFGAVDLVHLNAGYSGAVAAVVDSTTEDWDKTFGVNVRGVYLGLRAALRQFYAQGTGGAVVVTASTGALGGAQLFSGYVASKHAVLGLVRSAALEVARDGIRVNAVCPGLTETPMARASEDKADPDDRVRARALLEDQLPIGRYAEVSEMGAAVAWLLSDEASYVNAEAITVDGGRTSAANGYKAPSRG